MLIDFSEIQDALLSKNIKVTGALHIGAHECEELDFYHKLGLQDKDIIWIEAIPFKVSEAITKGMVNVYNALITDKDDEIVKFNVSNNIQSSSIYEFGTHSYEHPQVGYVGQAMLRSITVDSFFTRNKIDPLKYNFWNFDIQGAELLALKGAVKSMKNVKALYLEVNENELYKNCALINEIDGFLAEHGFQRTLVHMTSHGWGDALYVLDN